MTENKVQISFVGTVSELRLFLDDLEHAARPVVSESTELNKPTTSLLDGASAPEEVEPIPF